MNGIMFVLLSIGMKTWYEREKAKNYPPMIIRNIEKENFKRMVKVNIRGVG